MGKKTNKTKRRLREERQRAERAAERRRNLITIAIVVAVLAVGGVLMALSLDEGEPEIDPVDEGDEPGAEDAPGDDGADGDDADEDDEVGGETREVACGAEEPVGAGAAKETYEAPEHVIDSGERYEARLVTSCGDILLQLHAGRAPQTVNSFVFLAREGFYDGLEFYRSRPGLGLVQSGAGDDADGWQIGYTLPAELDVAKEEGYPPGAVAMAVPEGDPEGAGSEFFVVYSGRFEDAVAAGAVDVEYPRFATVTEGLEVAQEIGRLPTTGAGNDLPAERVYLERVEIGRS